MKPRNYKREAELETRADKDKRAARNRARRMVYNHLVEKYGERKARQMMANKDVDHKKALESGGQNKLSNLRLLNKKKNRSDKSAVKNPGRHKGH